MAPKTDDSGNGGDGGLLGLPLEWWGAIVAVICVVIILAAAAVFMRGRKKKPKQTSFYESYSTTSYSHNKQPPI